ncbi:hypothetical protein VNO80_21237 [Phaseolus coccineus]|uniref:Uncharacterized protein n=1 Tax=Phaseolus coccineus TaxID=3886 RepID=A0AAN9QT39_PHACN
MREVSRRKHTCGGMGTAKLAIQSSNGPNFKEMAKTELEEINQTTPWIIYMPVSHSWNFGQVPSSHDITVHQEFPHKFHHRNN